MNLHFLSVLHASFKMWLPYDGLVSPDCGIDFRDSMSLLGAVECHGISRCLVAFGVCLVPLGSRKLQFYLHLRALGLRAL